MATLIFIDGPFAEETKDFPGYAPPTFSVKVPNRTTWCHCNPTIDAVAIEKAAEVVQYYCVARGVEHSLGIYSVCKDEQAVVQALKAWVISDVTGPWHFGCRDRRAFK